MTKYIDAEKLINAIEEKGLDCSFALKMERLDTIALIEELQQEQPEVDLERDAVQFCFDKGLNLTPYQAKTIASHFYQLGKNSK